MMQRISDFFNKIASLAQTAKPEYQPVPTKSEDKKTAKVAGSFLSKEVVAKSLESTERPKFYVVALDRRIHALGDLAKMAVGALKMAAEKVQRLASAFFGFRTEIPKNHANEEEAELYLSGRWQHFPKFSTSIEKGGEQSPLVQAAIMLKSCKQAMKKMPDAILMKKNLEGSYRGNIDDKLKPLREGIKIESLLKNDLLKGLDKPGAQERLARKIKSHYREQFEKTGNKEWLEIFDSEVDKARGRLVPKEMSSEFVVGDKKFEEKIETLDANLGAKYLLAAGKGNLDKESDYVKEQGLRPSAVRSQDEAQGMIINGRVHELNGERIYRSGAFAVHNQGKTPGLDRLKEINKMPDNEEKDAAISDLAKKMGMAESKGKVDENTVNLLKTTLSAEIRKRECLVVAQALPKVAAAIKAMVADPDVMERVRTTGKFLYVEQSFLSDEASNEKRMIEDMKGALDALKEKLVVRYGDDEGLQVEDGKIILTFDSENLSKGEFGVESLLFSQGVNEMQSIGHLMKQTGYSYQDRINKESLEALFGYATEAGLNLNPEFTKLRDHYLPFAQRLGKDIEGVNLINDAVRALKGGRGISCKSGKDRTGTEAANRLARAVSSSAEERRAIREELFGRLSFAVTGQNTGKRNAYAFNALQYETLPPQWRPSKKYCGNVPS